MSEVKKTYKLVVFDWEGTLHDVSSSALCHLKQAVVDLKWPMFDETEYDALARLPMSRIIDALYSDFSEAEREPLKIRTQFHILLHKNEVELNRGAKETLKTLKQEGYFLAIATAKSSRGLASDLESLRIASWFDVIRTAEQTAPKPEPLMLEEIMANLNVLPQNTLMVGDNIVDIQMAANARVEAIGFSTDARQREVLLANGAAAAISELSDVLDYLKM